MNKIQDSLQAISNTIQSIDIKADYDTMNKLLGCLQLLAALKTEAANWEPTSKVDGEKTEAANWEPTSKVDGEKTEIIDESAQ